MSTPSLSVVVPAYQEGTGLAAGLRAIHAAARTTTLPFQLVVVDDGSTDDTWSTLRALEREMPELAAIRLSRNFGKEGAIAAGLDIATGDATIVMDADLQHPPALIVELVRRWRDEGWDVVEAVKSDRGRESFLHRVVTRAFYRAAAWLTGYDLQDASDFKLIDRRVLVEWRRLGERATFFRGLVAWLGFSRTQIAFDVPPRQTGASRWSLGALAGLAVHAVTSFSALPLQLVTILGLVMLLLAVGIGAQALRLWAEGLALPGFTTVILLQLLIGGLLMISMGIIGTYVARIYEEVKARPRYVVRDTLGTDDRGIGDRPTGGDRS
ncbi:MAG: glycosyltransferase family 2 protein [Acidobacteria bacterium]|nr:glycosyltransferase family 2 protein [Acidobacteriota bacterium]